MPLFATDFGGVAFRRVVRSSRRDERHATAQQAASVRSGGLSRSNRDALYRPLFARSISPRTRSPCRLQDTKRIAAMGAAGGPPRDDSIISRDLIVQDGMEVGNARVRDFHHLAILDYAHDTGHPALVHLNIVMNEIVVMREILKILGFKPLAMKRLVRFGPHVCPSRHRTSLGTGRVPIWIRVYDKR